MKVLVCGSRVWTDYKAIYDEIKKLPENTIIIHGDAKGADSLAELAARTLGLEYLAIPAEWERYKADPALRKYWRRAGIDRNLKMLDMQPDLVIAFITGASRGTRHTVAHAEKRNIKTKVIYG